MAVSRCSFSAQVWPKNSHRVLEMFFSFQYYKDDWPWARFWLFSLLTIQIIFCCTILIFWAVRLVKKGKSLATKDSQKSNDSDVHTGKSLSEAHIFASTNPQYDDRLFIELQVQYMKIPSSSLEIVVYSNCF